MTISQSVVFTVVRFTFRWLISSNDSGPFIENAMEHWPTMKRGLILDLVGFKTASGCCTFNPLLVYYC